jgi:hypothetical protein
MPPIDQAFCTADTVLLEFSLHRHRPDSHGIHVQDSAVAEGYRSWSRCLTHCLYLSPFISAFPRTLFEYRLLFHTATNYANERHCAYSLYFALRRDRAPKFNIQILQPLIFTPTPLDAFAWFKYLFNEISPVP